MKFHSGLFVLLLLAVGLFAEPVPGAFLVPSGSDVPLAGEDEIAYVQLESDPITGKNLLFIRLEARAAARMREYTAANIGGLLTVQVDGNLFAEMKIRESVEGAIALAEMKAAETDRLLSRHPNRLASELKDAAAFYAPQAGLPLFKPVLEKPGLYRAVLPKDREVLLYLKTWPKIPFEVEKTYERMKLEAAGNRTSLIKTESGIYILIVVPCGDGQESRRMVSVRGVMGTLFVGLNLLLSESEATPETEAEFEALFEKILRNLSAARDP